MNATRKYEITRIDSATDALLALQVQQYEHDEKYHPEIARLSVQRRLTHMTLHFAKYAAQLIEQADDEDAVRRIVVDTAIIATSCTNILNLKISDEIGAEICAESASIEQLGKSLAIAKGQSRMSLEEFSRQLSIAAGRLAAAAEKLDHLEEYPFRTVFRDEAVRLFSLALVYSSLHDWTLDVLIRDRLRSVKEKKKLHGFI